MIAWLLEQINSYAGFFHKYYQVSQFSNKLTEIYTNRMLGRNINNVRNFPSTTREIVQITEILQA